MPARLGDPLASEIISSLPHPPCPRLINYIHRRIYLLCSMESSYSYLGFSGLTLMNVILAVTPRGCHPWESYALERLSCPCRWDFASTAGREQRSGWARGPAAPGWGAQRTPHPSPEAGTLSGLLALAFPSFTMGPAGQRWPGGGVGVGALGLRGGFSSLWSLEPKSLSRK